MTKFHLFEADPANGAICNPRCKNNLEQELFDYLRSRNFPFPPDNFCRNCQRQVNFLLEADPRYLRYRCDYICNTGTVTLPFDTASDATPLTLPIGARTLSESYTK